MKLFYTTCRETGVFKWAHFLGKARPLKFGRAKTSKIQLDFWQLSSLIANISGTDPHVENRKSSWLQPLPRWAKKDSELWSTNKKVIGAHVGISARFQTTFHFYLPGGVAARGIWTTQNCLCSWTCGAGRPHVGLCPIFLVKLELSWVESWTARRAVVCWRQPTTWTRPVELTR